MFPEKKSLTLLFGVLIKRQILTSREVLYTKLVRVISPCFAKKMLSKIRVFSRLKCQLSSKLTHHVLQRVSNFQPTRKWLNKVNLSKFSTQNLFQIRACVISA